MKIVRANIHRKGFIIWTITDTIDTIHIVPVKEYPVRL